MVDVKQAPRALKIIVVLMYLGAIVFAAMAVVAFADDDPAFGILFVLGGVLSAVLAYGLLRADRRARTATLVLQVLAFLQALFDLANGRVDLSLLLAPAIVFTLLRDREVVAWFEQPDAAG